MSDIWYQAYEIILGRYKSAKQAIRILQKEVRKLNNQIHAGPGYQDPKTIARLSKRISDQSEEIRRLNGLLDKRCGKIRIYNLQDAEDFAGYISNKKGEVHQIYFHEDCDAYHIRHRDKRLRGKNYEKR